MTNPIAIACLPLLMSGLAIAQGNPQLQALTASTLPMQYFASLPKGWSAAKSWPVVMVVPDAGRDFKGNLAAFVRARKDLPFN